MKTLKTKAIVLSRVNYGETDRILTVITPDLGKLRLIARGVRVIKSKLAGGIELFSVNDISFIKGRSDVYTLTSSRLSQNYGHIIKDINRVQFGYEILKTIHKTTEDVTDKEFFNLLEFSLSTLNDVRIPLDLSRIVFMSRLLAVSGHAPNLNKDNSGKILSESSKYKFDIETMAFYPEESGNYTANDIKFLRIVFSVEDIRLLSKIADAESYAVRLIPLVNSMHLNHLSR